MDQQRETEILDGLRAGDPGAWRALYDAHVGAVWQYVALRLGPQRSDVSDVVQEIFLAAARSVRTYDLAQGSLSRWLVGIARRQIALHFRAEARQSRIRRLAESWGPHAQQVAEWLDDREALPGEVLESQELSTLLRAALAELEPTYEELLTQKYLEGISVQQLAAASNSTETAIRSKLARARKMLRRILLTRLAAGSMSEQGNG